VSRTIADLPADVAARYPYRSRFAIVNGRRMHYVDEGPPAHAGLPCSSNTGGVPNDAAPFVAHA
jgi:hypothetical protein